jgi:hypothetical protein
MSYQPISEKIAEILFNRFFLQASPLGSLELFAPSSAEEFRRGYDAKVIGRSTFREIYLQFKAPYFSTNQDRFRIRPTEHQHNLLREYTAFSAFYVVPSFRSLQELNAAQTKIRASADFLKFFVCIEVSCLPAKINFFHYWHVDTKRGCPKVCYKIPDDGSVRTVKHLVPAKRRLLGTKLASLLRSKKVGHTVSLSPVTDDSHPAFLEGEAGIRGIWNPESTDVFRISDNCKPADFGIFVRENLE